MGVGIKLGTTKKVLVRFKRVIDTAITLLRTSDASSLAWPYNMDYTLYKNINCEKYKGVRIKIDAAKIATNFRTAETYMRIKSTDEAYVQIAYDFKDAWEVNHPTSSAGSTVTLLFKNSAGTVDLQIIGGGGSTCSYNYTLSNAVLLAR